MIAVAALRCNVCGDVIYTLKGRDLRWCNCRSIASEGNCTKGTVRATGLKENYTVIIIQLKKL